MLLDDLVLLGAGGSHGGTTRTPARGTVIITGRDNEHWHITLRTRIATLSRWPSRWGTLAHKDVMSRVLSGACSVLKGPAQ